MPRRYDRAGTSKLLLDAAIDEFADMGMHGARVDRIAENAGTNKSGIYSYFGSKEDFFAATIEAVMTRMAEEVPINAVPLDGDDLPGYAVQLFDHVCDHPEVVRLFEHEASHYADDLTAVPAFAARADAHGARVRTIGEVTGDDVDPESLLMSVIAMAHWFVAAPQVVRMIYGPDHDEARRRYREHVRAMVTAVLAGP